MEAAVGENEQPKVNPKKRKTRRKCHDSNDENHVCSPDHVRVPAHCRLKRHRRKKAIRQIRVSLLSDGVQPVTKKNVHGLSKDLSGTQS